MDAFHMDVIRTLDELKAQQTKIRADAMLSDVGKNKSLAELAGKKQRLAGDAIIAFKADWTKARRAFAEVTAQREQIAELNAKRWDYQRLNYESAQAKATILAANSPEELQQRYEGLKLAGDRHALRAFAETGAGMLGESKKFSDAGSTAYLKDIMQKDARRILDTPEVIAQRARESQFSDQIAKLAEATNNAADEFYPSKDVFSGPSPFSELTAGVSVRYSVDPETLSTKTIVDLDWE